MSGLNPPLLNPEIKATSEFPLFAKFPTEIRDQIWEQSLTHERILKIYLWNMCPFESKGDCFVDLYDILKSTTTTRLDDWQRTGTNPGGTLYLRPELDTICMALTAGFGLFAHCVWALDPLHVGLINISPKAVIIFPDGVVEGRLWKEGVSRLQNVIFFELFPARQVARQQVGIPGLSPGPWLPVSVNISSFDRLPQDPRVLTSRFTPLYLPMERLKAQVAYWFRLLEEEHISMSHEVNYSCMFGLEYASYEHHLDMPTAGRHATEGYIQKIGERGVQPAIGFWLLPMECLGYLRDDDGTFTSSDDDPNLDELKFKFELCLSRLT
ncbi:uncharacterized protein BKA55DRAFT_505565 [Fusarium redolens]|uniref:2EXR domain-containing protein n=1 Tax=Fusarium redolens TaxID=48865 RepID=A0A9P9HJV2_FUSRE|nr:uncharacterized protein BKA55DRAFT_505565 [Fusarium redolens]KAH7259008.1 hypothetical protein BKA55DRAFT_505565 [Fusarium redolens]